MLRQARRTRREYIRVGSTAASMRPTVLRACLNILLPVSLLFVAPCAFAEQYRSESRIVNPTGETKSNDQLLKESQGNPYAQALILQQQALAAIDKKDYASAIQKYEQALGLGALSELAVGDMRYNLAQLYLAQDEYKKAGAALEQWLAAAQAGNQKPPPEAFAALAAAYVGQKKPREAVVQLKKAVAQDPQPRREWLQLQFSIHFQLGELEQCVKVLEEMLNKFPPDKETWLQLVALNSKLKKPREAASAMALAYKQGFLDKPEERLQLAKLLVAANQPYDAGALLDQWLQKSEIPADAGNWELLAAAWIKARERQRALQAMNKAVALTGKPAQYLEIAQLNLELERWSDAAEALREAFRRGLGPKEKGKAYLALGFAHYMGGEPEAAAQAFTAAATQPGSEKSARAWLAFVEAGIAPTRSARAALRDETGAAPTALDVAKVPEARAGLSNEALRGIGGPAGQALADGLTPVGATAAGSADGRIPPWTGGLTPDKAPAGATLNAKPTDPYPDDKPLFVVDPSNYKQYAEQLSLGHQELLRRHKGYKLPVFPSRRTAAYPQAIYDASVANQKTAKLVDPDVLEGAKLGFPFRIPKTGNEVLWNHRVHYRGESLTFPVSSAAMVNPDTFVIGKGQVELYFVYANQRAPGEIKANAILLYYLGRIIEPPRLAGTTVLAHETTDLKRGRDVWVAIPGSQKLFRIPSNIGYDNPYPGTEGMLYIDQINMYNGGFDRYTWKLLGRRPMLVPYNSYRTNDPKLKYKDLLRARHYNPEHTRYELHRVWVVEAATRPGQSHNFSKRVFYVDEDSWVILMVECFDKSGKFWRFQEGHGLSFYNVPMTSTAPEMIYDFKSDRYYAGVLTNEEPAPVFNSGKYSQGYFNPGSVRARLK